MAWHASLGDVGGHWLGLLLLGEVAAHRAPLRQRADSRGLAAIPRRGSEPRERDRGHAALRGLRRRGLQLDVLVLRQLQRVLRGASADVHLTGCAIVGQVTNHLGNARGHRIRVDGHAELRAGRTRRSPSQAQHPGLRAPPRRGRGLGLCRAQRLEAHETDEGLPRALGTRGVRVRPAVFCLCGDTPEFDLWQLRVLRCQGLGPQ
mmetsp:Transcript_149701/g.372606  ORF Transcript_149701/g.372606 Transcript_149701/m.372606 type:complete len:205 (+) Transcript_149701:240-854(+)